MENIATATPGQIAFFIVGCILFGLVFAVWLFSGSKKEDAPTVTLDPVALVGQLWSDILNWRPVHMSSSEDRIPASEASISGNWGGDFSPSIPVWNTSIHTSDDTSEELPRFHRDITEDDELRGLCMVRNKDGKYRHSANKIYEFVGGDRNTVMAKIKEIRATPEFRQPDGTVAPASRPITGRAA